MKHVIWFAAFALMLMLWNCGSNNISLSPGEKALLAANSSAALASSSSDSAQQVYSSSNVVLSSSDGFPTSSDVVVVSSGVSASSSSVTLASSSSVGAFSSVALTSSGGMKPSSSSAIFPSSSSAILPSSSAVKPLSSSVVLPSSSAATLATGTVTVTYTPVDDKGSFSPKNANAIWIQSGTTWVANIVAHAKTYAKYLNLWRTVYSTTLTTGVDGVAGASQTSFTAQTGTWNAAGKALGTYRVYMQFATSDANGKSAYVDFKLGSSALDTTVASLNTYFTNIHITYKP